MLKLRYGPVQPDWQSLLGCLQRQGTPRRVHFMELFLDEEVQDEIGRRFGLLKDLKRDDPFFFAQRKLRVQAFLGYDYVCCGLDSFGLPLKHLKADDTAALARRDGRSFIEEHQGPITTWEEFESYPWPDFDRAPVRYLEWYSENMPETMCLIGFGFAHFCEHLTWLMGYETLCFALHDQPDLVAAISRRLIEIHEKALRLFLQFDRMKALWASDDMGFRSGPLISPADLRQYVLPGHKRMAAITHAAGRPYLLHACGNLREIMGDLLDDVRIDAKHSFEDTIESVIDAKAQYGGRIALIGGIDVDFLCRASEAQIRRRVRETLEACQPGGGYCLGSGNSIANYIPVDKYLAMLDEGRKYGG